MSSLVTQRPPITMKECSWLCARQISTLTAVEISWSGLQGRKASEIVALPDEIMSKDCPQQAGCPYASTGDSADSGRGVNLSVGTATNVRRLTDCSTMQQQRDRPAHCMPASDTGICPLGYGKGTMDQAQGKCPLGFKSGVLEGSPLNCRRYEVYQPVPLNPEFCALSISFGSRVLL